jgi:GNAT superfamily N-acetyltransferase
MPITYQAGDDSLTADEFMDLFSQVWQRKPDLDRVGSALRSTINISARDSGRLVAWVRVLTDGYFAAVVTEVLVHPDFRNQGVSQRLMELAYECSPTSIMFGAQRTPDELMNGIGWQQGPNIYFKRK